MTAPEPPARTAAVRGEASGAAGARLLLVMLALAWGFNWTAARLALDEVAPWGLRFVGIGLGMVVLFTVALVRRRSLRVPPQQRIHIAVAGFLNVAAFNVLAAFAQTHAATSRAVIIAYSMPIWATVLARFMLGERLTPMRMVAVLLCGAGLTVLLWPLFAHGWPTGMIYALGCALAWAGGTVYVKWARFVAEPLAIAAWQVGVGWTLITAGMLVFSGVPQLWPLQPVTIAALVYNGLIGIGLAYFLWFTIVGRLPTATASLGSLMVPVVGVVVSAVVLGERPSLNDIIGFALIFLAAACVLLPGRRG